MKRTNLVLDADLLEEATRLSGERTYSRTVERALQEFVRRAKRGGFSTWPGRASGRATWRSSGRTAACIGPVAVVLVDTSVWIAVFRQGSQLSLEDVVNFDDVVTCLPVVQEVLQGFQDPKAFNRARDAMYALPIVDSPMPQAAFDQAVDLYRATQRAGLTVRSVVDCLIAASAIRHHLEILHDDRDYDTLARVSTLQVRRLKKTGRSSA